MVFVEGCQQACAVSKIYIVRYLGVSGFFDVWFVARFTQLGLEREWLSTLIQR